MRGKSKMRGIPFFISTILLLLCGFLCSACYTLGQGSIMLSYLSRAEPLDKLAASGNEADKAFAERVADIRSFAMNDLGLTRSKNYTTYVSLTNKDGSPRTYLAAVVSASKPDSLTPYTWWFPVVGSVPYKGFFNVEGARKEQAKLEKKGLDVWVRGVDAFSTLGWFRDPLYSYMKNYSDKELADLIIHELLHATVYINGAGQFDEGLAQFVGSEGSRLYIKTRFGEKALSSEDKKEAEAEADSKTYIAFLKGLSEKLDAVYKDASLSRAEKLKRKAEIIAETQKDFTARYDLLFKTPNYKGFAKLPINNAYLELYSLYYEDDNYFADLYKRSPITKGSDIRAFITAAKTIRKGKGDLKKQLETALGL
jgi:predicted aminopeptidase